MVYLDKVLRAARIGSLLDMLRQSTPVALMT